MVYSKEQKIKIVEWWFESKCYKTVRRRYAREFNVRYVEAPEAYRAKIYPIHSPKVHD